MSAREQRRILTELGHLKNQVVRLETKVDILQQSPGNAAPPPPVYVPAPQSQTPFLPTLGGTVGLIAGTILTWQQLTGKA